jgi:hypothetical protein
MTSNDYSHLQPDSIRCVRVADDKEEIENGGGSKLRRMLQAREYKCHSKELYIVVKVRIG